MVIKYTYYNTFEWKAYRRVVNTTRPATGPVHTPASIDDTIGGIIKTINEATKHYRRTRRIGEDTVIL